MRGLIAIALIAALGAAGLAYAWHVLGELPQAQPAMPQPAGDAAQGDDAHGGAQELDPVHAREAAAVRAAEPVAPPRPTGLEDGGATPLARDYAAIYAERTPVERRAAAARLATRIAAAQEALGAAEREELAGRRGSNQPTTPGVAHLLALVEERAWLLASLPRETAQVPAEDP
jgi:hypothetical protein